MEKQILLLCSVMLLKLFKLFCTAFWNTIHYKLYWKNYKKVSIFTFRYLEIFKILLTNTSFHIPKLAKNRSKPFKQFLKNDLLEASLVGKRSNMVTHHLSLIGLF